MKFEQIRDRVGSLGVPVFGRSDWKPSKREVGRAHAVITFLEDRRVLFNELNIESPEFCTQSVLQIRQHLTAFLQDLGPKSALAPHVRAILGACREYLDGDEPRALQYLRGGDWMASGAFGLRLGKLRADIGLRVAILAVMYGLDVSSELAASLPAGPASS